ncbi:glycoside hydrolase family 71/99-like protein [Neotamlana laminarinivorans]|uniref:Glycosyl hydrolase family 99 n=1 Tax=Neotamlana laminarinivorans TaxID=2883124 RepID=A0A9X1HZH9_9FLAO|nr:glycoside hydrolase family 71/99-like protein [Tamlana laminarinivorans]MCB4798646.1 hypothetical protein [Tamlana laminarinivorans]
MTLTKNNIIKLILSSIIIFAVSCNKEEIGFSEKNDTNIYIIPEYNETYNDSILKAVLHEELTILNTSFLKDATTKSDGEMEIDKSNPKKVYVHYLPWFQSKDYDGYWGQHWTMTNRNPDNLDQNGLQEIASYYNPLIGPYSSSDPDLQEYHFLLMKLSGIDGVIFDWYGSRDIHDYGLIKQATETFIPKLENVGLDFSIMYEDRVAYINIDGNESTPVERAKKDFNYIKQEYFTSSNYLEFNGNKIISVFGPHYLTNAHEWGAINSVFNTSDTPSLISLWGLSNNLGGYFNGEFLWVAPDHLAAQDYFYNTYANTNEINIGSTYPGFKSYYAEGGWSDGINNWELPENNGLTFIETLNNSSLKSADFIQLITWNDFGEGTMLEPTAQFGYKYLTMLQEYTGSKFDENDLATATKLYNARKTYNNNPRIQNILNNSYIYMKQLKINRVNRILQAIDRYHESI